MHITLILTLIVYYSLALGIGLARSRKSTKSQYITAPNSTGFVSLTLSLLGTIVGGGMFLGIAELGYGGGTLVFGLGVAYLFGSIIMGVLAPSIRAYMRKKEVLTLFDLIDKLYPRSLVGKHLRLSSVFAVATFLVFFLMLAVQFVAIASFGSYFTNIGFDKAVIIGAGVVAALSILVYTAVGGFKKDVITDMLQIGFIVIGLIILFVYGMSSVDVFSAIGKLPPDYFSFGGGYSFIFTIGVLLFVAPTFFARFDIWQRIITAKSDNTARASFITSGVLAFVFFSMFGLIGMYAKATGITTAKYCALSVVQQLLHGLPFAVVIAAFFAAVMSSADTFLGVSGLALSRLVYGPKAVSANSEAGKSGISVKKLRYMTACVGAISMIVAYYSGEIIDLFTIAFSLLMVFLPAIIGGIVRQSPANREAIWSIMMGFVVLIVAIPFMTNEAFLPASLISVITYYIALKHNHQVPS